MWWPRQTAPEGAPKNTSCADGSGTDDYGHGTHVAGTIGARDNNIGVVGTVPGARLHAVRVLRVDGQGYWSWIIAGIDWVTARASTIEVANMSLGGGASASSGNCVSDGACDDDPDGTQEPLIMAAAPLDCTQSADHNVCVDQSECTTDSCNATTGNCEHAPLTAGTPCAAGQCDATGNCVECLTDGDCADDGNICTAEACNAGSCGSTPIANCCLADNECGDQNACTTDSCSANCCVNTPIQGCSSCLALDETCDPANDSCCSATSCQERGKSGKYRCK